MRMDIFKMIAIMAIVTYGARVLPFVLFRNKKLSGLLKIFIELVPVALLAALVIPEFFLSSENMLTVINPFFFAGICTFLFARLVPNLFLAILFGMLVFWGFDKMI